MDTAAQYLYIFSVYTANQKQRRYQQHKHICNNVCIES